MRASFAVTLPSRATRTNASFEATTLNVAAGAAGASCFWRSRSPMRGFSGMGSGLR